MAFQLNIGSEELVRFTDKLEGMNRKGVPFAIRNTLNTLAFDVKQKTLPDEFTKSFTIRSKGFVRAFSGVSKAGGYRIDKMQAVVGMTSGKRGGAPEQAGLDMKQQQLGGTIGGRTLIPLDTARSSKNNAKMVRKVNRIGSIKGAYDTRDSRGKNNRQRFVKTAIYAIKKKGAEAFVKHRRDDGKEILYRIKKGGSSIKTREFNLKVEPLYTIKDGRSVSVKGVPFTKRAANTSMKRIHNIYKLEIKKQLDRL
jgi:hypothetical protein